MKNYKIDAQLTMRYSWNVLNFQQIYTASKQERECIIDDTKNILSTSGPDNDLSAHRSDPNFDARVAILSKLSGQNLIKLREEHPIGDEL